MPIGLTPNHFILLRYSSYPIDHHHLQVTKAKKMMNNATATNKTNHMNPNIKKLVKNNKHVIISQAMTEPSHTRVCVSIDILIRLNHNILVLLTYFVPIGLAQKPILYKQAQAQRP